MHETQRHSLKWQKKPVATATAGSSPQTLGEQNGHEKGTLQSSADQSAKL
jgi:hypothetical protein